MTKRALDKEYNRKVTIKFNYFILDNERHVTWKIKGRFRRVSIGK